MLLLLEYLPQEPSDSVYGTIVLGISKYEWVAQSQYRVSTPSLLSLVPVSAGK